MLNDKHPKAVGKPFFMHRTRNIFKLIRVKPKLMITCEVQTYLWRDT